MGRAPERAARLYFRASGASGEDAHGPRSFQHRQTRACGRRKPFAWAERESRRLSCRRSFAGQGGVRSFTCAFGLFSRACGLASSKAGEFARCIDISCCGGGIAGRVIITGPIGSTCWSQPSISGQIGARRSFTCESICFSSGFGFSEAGEFACCIGISCCCDRIAGRVTGAGGVESACCWSQPSSGRASRECRRGPNRKPGWC